MDQPDGEGMAQQAQVAQNFANFVEHFKRTRDHHITMAARITRILDFIEAHPDVQEMLRLLDEMNSPVG